MKRILTACLLCFAAYSSSDAQVFQQVWSAFNGTEVPTSGTRKLFPLRYQVTVLDQQYLKDWLFSLPEQPEQARVMDLPSPDGSFVSFKVWQTPVMASALAARYPEIKTFSGYALNNHAVTLKMDYTHAGFHAMVLAGTDTWFIDPYSDIADGYYLSYYKKDYPVSAASRMHCELETASDLHAAQRIDLGGYDLPPVQLKVNGATKKSYRLALACTGEYAVAVAGVNPAKPVVLSAMVTSVNRVNGVYEREFAVSLNLIGNTDTLIFLDGATDPYSNSNGPTMLGQNQTTITNYIGTANYDIGHVFSTGGGGIASLGSVCKANEKARGVTGSSNPSGDPFDIDYVAHEMGHQFGGNHTFNSSDGSCSGNGVASRAYEPGSGTTIMAYAGICDADDLQQHSDDYFHGMSLSEMSDYINYANGGAACPIATPSNNTPPVIPAFSNNYTIPEKTPFELIAPEAIDTDHDTLTYCWEQWNRGNFGQSFNSVRTRGPIFRSFEPNASRTRVFPVIQKVLQGINTYLGEKLPDTTRYLTFKLTVRDIYNGFGSFNLSDDTIHLDVTELAGPFKVTSHNAPATLTGSTSTTVTWDVANTDQAPVFCDSVVISLSVDGGLTYPITLNSGTPNDGSETVMIPNMSVASARIKVKGKGNVFFNVNAASFAIAFNTAVADVSWKNAVSVYPVPATSSLFVRSELKKPMKAKILNTIGQQIWEGTVEGQQEIYVAPWAKGIYYLHLENDSRERLVKPIIIR